MDLEISYSNDGSEVTAEDIQRGDTCIPPNQVYHFWKKYMPYKQKYRPMPASLPAEFAYHARGVVAHSLDSHSSLVRQRVKQGGLPESRFKAEIDEALSMMRAMVRQLTGDAVKNVIDRFGPGKKHDLRPLLLSEGLPHNPFGNMAGGFAGPADALCGDLAAIAGQDAELLASVDDLIQRFTDSVRQNPSVIRESENLALTGGQWGDLDKLITASGSDLKHGSWSKTIDELDRLAPLPVVGGKHLGYYQRRSRVGSSGTLYFGGVSRQEVAEGVVSGVEFGFETANREHNLTLRPVYGYQTTWDVDVPNGVSDGIPTLFDADGNKVEYHPGD